MDGKKIIVCKKCVFKYVGKNFDQERGYSKLIIEVIICMIMVYVFLFMVSIFYYILCNKLQSYVLFLICVGQLISLNIFGVLSVIVQKFGYIEYSVICGKCIS